MPPAVRQFDVTGHPGLISTAVVTSVRINSLPAATVGDVHTCFLPPVVGPHPPNTIAKGSATVNIGKRPAARQGDITGCGAPIISGSLNVFIGG